MNIIGRRLHAETPSSVRQYVSWNQKAPAMPYVYQLANSDAAIPIGYEKIGTPTAKTKESAFMTKIKKAYIPQPVNMWLWRCSELRNRRMEINFAAVCFCH